MMILICLCVCVYLIYSQVISREARNFLARFELREKRTKGYYIHDDIDFFILFIIIKSVDTIPVLLGGFASNLARGEKFSREI